MGINERDDGADTLRTFLAIELPSTVRGAVQGVQGDIRRRLAHGVAERGVRWTNPDGIHLTLKFLGATRADQVGEIRGKTVAALVGHGRLRLSLGAPGVFASVGSPRVLWIGLDGDLGALNVLQRTIDAAMASLGFPPESRPFTPHLTLARFGDRLGGAARLAIVDAISEQIRSAESSFEVERVSLMRSELGNGGARYSRLWAADLDQGDVESMPS